MGGRMEEFLRHEAEWFARARADGTAHTLTGLRRQLSALKIEADSLRKDAERYRWLRNVANYTNDDTVPIVRGGAPYRDGNYHILIHDKLDLAIDKYMAIVKP